MTVDSGEAFTVEVRGAFDNVQDISAVPTPSTPACDGHPLAPIAGPIVVRGGKPGDVVAIDLIELTPFGSGKSAILRDFGVLRREFPEPMALSSPGRGGRAGFGGRMEGITGGRPSRTTVQREEKCSVSWATARTSSYRETKYAPMNRSV